MTGRSSEGCVRPAVLLLLVVLCLFVVGGLLFLEQLPTAAARDFGPPSPALSTPSRVWYAAQLELRRQELLLPRDPTGPAQPFEIGSGESVGAIAARLESAGLIWNADIFRVYMIYAGLDRSIQAGSYQLSPAQTPLEIAHAMQDATPSEVSFYLLPGWRAEEVAAALPLNGLSIDPQTFIALVQNPPLAILPPGWSISGSLEGYLYPGEYQLRRDYSAEQILQTFLLRFEEQVPMDLRVEFERRGLSLAEAVTLASIVQREAVVEDERPLVASVFYNRLAAGMTLGSDPTVQYALGYNSAQSTWWTNPLSINDLQVYSPYNTYQIIGLPPGPICSPAISSLQAVAYPADSPYYYFRALCDGSGRHVFAVTYDEHLQNACP